VSPEIRIGSGQFKGRRISSVSSGYRPTSGIVKKSLFDSLAAEIVDSLWLDLFAGSGAIGIEALSRGAKYVCFVENSLQRIATLRKNIDKFELPKGAVEVYAVEYDHALEILMKRGVKFDFIYIDPPYSGIEPARILGDVATSNVLSDDGIIVYESASHDVKKLTEAIPDRLYPYKDSTLGSTSLLYLRWRRDHSGDNIERLI
jgi:16S rRNA (guanine966-N2)-methyltransferase